jgi:hypothetical protein
VKALEVALTNKLRGDTALMAFLPGGVHNVVEAVGDATPYPYMLFGKKGMEPEYVMSGLPLRTYTYQFYVIGRDQGKDTLEDALARLDVLLANQALTVTGYTWLSTLLIGDDPDTVSLSGGLLLRVSASYKIMLEG